MKDEQRDAFWGDNCRNRITISYQLCSIDKGKIRTKRILSCCHDQHSFLSNRSDGPSCKRICCMMSSDARMEILLLSISNTSGRLEVCLRHLFEHLTRFLSTTCVMKSHNQGLSYQLNDVTIPS